MSRYTAADIARRAHIRSLYVVILLQFLAMAGLWYGWKTAPEDIRVSLPPDRRDGAIVRPGHMEAATVFNFAMSTMRELQRWEENGAIDYGKKIYERQAYLTPCFREFLIADMNARNAAGELTERVRYALELPDSTLYREDLVEVIDAGSWVVTANLEIVERVASTDVKDVAIAYPLHVVRMNIAPEQNEWGLALDCYLDGRRPEEIPLEQPDIDG